MPAHPWILLVVVVGIPAGLAAIGEIVGIVSRRLWP